MSRDHTKLRIFIASDALVTEIYLLTKSLPPEERYGLMSQLRRAVVSVPTNIVEGAVRQRDKHYLRYLETSLGSACETRYLLDLCGRLQLLEPVRCAKVAEQYGDVVKGLAALIARIDSQLV